MMLEIVCSFEQDTVVVVNLKRSMFDTVKVRNV